MYEIEKYCNINIGGTANLLQIIANEENSIEKVIIASSRSIYGEGAYENKIGENSILPIEISKICRMATLM